MKDFKTIFIILLTVLNLLIVSCGKSNASAGFYRMETLYGYPCITNDVSIWCDNN